MDNKGFTLIELLAVIVILAIIALIATPMVLGVINDSKSSTVEISYKNYKEAVYQSMAQYKVKNPVVKLDGTYRIDDDGKKLTNILNTNIVLAINFDGQGLSDGTIKILNDRIVKVSSSKIGDYYVRSINGDSFEKSLESFDTPATCFISTTSGEINYYLAGQSGCGNSVTIPVSLTLPIMEVDVANLEFSYDKCIEEYKVSECNDIQLHLQQEDYTYLIDEYMDGEFCLETLYKLFNTITYINTGNTSIITTIGEKAFFDMGLVKVDIQDNITNIKYFSFASNNISNLYLGSSITTIGTKAFMKNNLQSLVLPDSLVEIGDNSFSNNYIRTILIPNTVTYIGTGAFNYISNLSSVKIDNAIGNVVLSSDSFGSVTPTWLR